MPLKNNEFFVTFADLQCVKNINADLKVRKEVTSTKEFYVYTSGNGSFGVGCREFDGICK